MTNLIQTMKATKQMKTRHHNNMASATTGFARRALLLVSFLLLGLGSAWGVNWSDGSSAKDMGIFQIGAPSSVNYSFNVFDYVSLEEMLTAVNQEAGTAYSEDEFWQHFYARWSVICSDGQNVIWNPYYDDGGGHIWRSLQSQKRNYGIADDKYVYTFYCGIRDADYDNYGSWPIVFDTSILNMTCVVSDNASASLQNIEGATFVLYISTIDKVGATPGDQWGNNASFDNEGTLLLKYTFVAEDKDDSFYGTLDDEAKNSTKPYVINKEAENTTKVIIDFEPTIENPVYARYGLMVDGKLQDISWNALTLGSEENNANGQKSEEWKKRGLYVYNSGGLTSEDLKVTVTLADKNFEDYQLVAFFSNTAPRLFGNDDFTIEQEPEYLYEKQIYNISHYVEIRNQYIIAWDTNTYTFNLIDLIEKEEEFLPGFANNHSTGYIGWSVYDGPYDTGSKVNINGNTWAPPVHPDWAIDFGNGESKTTWSVSGSDVSSNWDKYTNIRVQAPSNFKDYSDYIVVADVSDESSSKIKVRYIFHFTEDGLKPDGFRNDDNSKASFEKLFETVTLKSPIYDTTNNTVTLSKPDNWPIEDVRYVRWYIVNANGELLNAEDKSSEWIENPSDGFTTDSEGSHGWYWHSETAQSTSTLQIPKVVFPVGKNFETYRLVAVMSTDEGTTDGEIFKEPVYTLMYYFNFELPFRAETITETVTKEFSVKPKDWLQNFKVAFDYQANKIKLCTQWEDLSSVDIDESLWSSYSGGTLSGSFYVRWFLQDAKTGEEQYFEGALVDGNGIYNVPEKPRYGLYWETTTSTETELAKIMQMTVDYTKVDLSRYNLVCTIATDLNDMVYNNDALVLEPSTMNLKCVFKLVDTDWAGIENPQWTHTREVFVSNTNATAGKVTIPLAESYTRILTEYGVMGKELGESFHMRWYVTYKDDPIYSQSLLTPNQSAGYDYIGKLGIYWNSLTSGVANPLASEPADKDPTVSNLFNVDFEKPENGDWSDYKVIVVMSRDLDAQPPTGNLSELTHEPTELTMKYVFRFYTEGNFQFVHYQGESNRPYMTSKTDNRIKDNDIQYYGWDRELGEPVKVDGAIRQGVHTVELEVYVDPNESATVLPLPLEKYYSFKNQQSENGNILEPAAYFRWYDWATDLHSSQLTIYGSNLEQRTDAQGERGLFMLNCKTAGNSPSHNWVGVTYDPSNLTSINSVDYIACDVSKYFDGIYDGTNNTVLLHEPTLSLRYIFTIRPSSYIVDKIQGDVNKQKGSLYFNTVKSQLGNGEKKYSEVKGTMFNLYENRGRVIVSLKDDSGEFSVRTGLPTFGDYYIAENQRCSDVQWYAYYEDAKGLWYNKVPLNPTGKCSDDGRVSTFKLSDLKGTYELLSTSSDNKTNFTPSFGSIVHVIGCVGNGATEVEAIHYELQFFNAPAILITELSDSKMKESKEAVEVAKERYDESVASGNWDIENKKKAYNEALDAYIGKMKRTKAYFYENYNSEGVVNFDNYFEDGKEPTSQFENMTFEPFDWDEAQYGFCYPNIDRFRILTSDYNSQWSGLTPIHGDYMILKSINKLDVSTNDITPYDYYFYEYATGNPEIDDYTKTMGGEWGGFMYVDASDETRTIATLGFEADLCHGSHIYFTAAVADVTIHVAPQLMAKVYGVKENGESVLVISFLTGLLSSNCDEGHQKGKWYQVYGEGTIPEYIDLTGVTSYKVEVVNFSPNTFGADYCVDEICFYTSTAKVLLTHAGSSNCDDEGEETGETVLAYMEAEGLQNAFGVYDDPQPIYWRICEKGTKKPITGVGMYPQYKLVDGNVVLDNDDTDGTKRNTYGITYVVSDYNAEGVDITEHPEIPESYGWYKDDNGKYFFQITNKTFDALERGKNYYVSVYTAGFDIINNYHEEYWGSEDDPCSIYSEFFVPRRQYVTYIVDPVTGKEGGDLTIDCGSDGVEVNGMKMILKVPYNDGISEGFKDYEVHFDYVISSMDNWNTTDVLLGEGTTYTYANLRDAWRDYRNTYPTYNRGEGETGIVSDYVNIVDGINYCAVLEYALANNILILANSTTFTYNFSNEGKYPIMCLPIEDKIYESEEDKMGKTVCAPFEVIFTVKKGDGPSLTLGFEGVDYTGKGIRVVRVGKKQLDKMQDTDEGKGFLLHIPVNKFKTSDDATENTGALTIVSEHLELLKYDATEVANNAKDAADDTWTNDPKVGDENVYVATFDGQEISANKKYISLKFHDDADVTKQDFKEGFTYRMFFQVKDATKANDETACGAGVEFLMKVVPEYVTWNDEATTGDGAVTPNANNGTNWNNDKNWSRSRKAELHKTAAHNSDNYQDNGTGTGDNGVASTPATFVPMKFTYVTIPSGNVAPKLIGLTRGEDGIYTDMGNDATANIQYDLMVKVENECGHDNVTTNVYDCEKFYGNWAKEIYFKPCAELLHQQFLTYGKAWVEKELVANKWYLMSTPLKATYAGDMYVPTDGRQETEAFKAIYFTDKVTKGQQEVNLYSRTAYPIYQRSWGMKDGTVYIQKSDIYRSDYSANLDYTEWQGNIIEWGHTFNDVDVPYTTRSGFSIRAHKKDQTAKALIRLPKDDISYSYYGYDTGEGKYTEQGDAVSKLTKAATDIGQFLTEPDDADITLNLDDAQQMGGYVLVGNPYMASLNMEAFFDEKANPNLTKGYYTYRYDEDKKEYEIGVYDETKGFGIIRPLESFFVNKGTATEIKFTDDMMIDGNTYQKTAPSRAFALTASNNYGLSSATVSVGEEAKSVETLFDSNLSDVPMVYTVADGQAVSINQVTELSRPIAFGVTCTASNEPVTVAFSDIAQLTSGEVYVVDAVTGEQTLVTEGSTLSVQPNDYGRYFLLAGTMGISDKTDVQKGITVSVRGKEVTVTSVEALTLVRALSPDGTTVHQDAPNGMSQSFTLASGVYVIQAENAASERQTVKVVVR